MRRDVKEYIKVCDACANRKTGHRIHAPMGEALEANEFLDVVSLDVVGHLPVIHKQIEFVNECINY
jgi:hypothetical protein